MHSDRNSVWRTVIPLLLLVAGLVTAALNSAYEMKIIGAAAAAIAAVWLAASRIGKKDEQRQRANTSQKPLQWYQSPLVWIPIIAIIGYLLSLLLRH
ncbi:hypothetical protein [Idiomarina xiamenensis]|uniref:Transmembrane protein n=1 Tax=Idiomarina xiamenensis 10-D-4 TaxID=740709 RepID=K2KJC5_9GAMM|nr:hypothetical protein [Idiomarina xiamenensis]EKE86837.1 hypothetical protein A10D4_01307 [Idiomarina xiamenensis 10-D-4]